MTRNQILVLPDDKRVLRNIHMVDRCQTFYIERPESDTVVIDLTYYLEQGEVISGVDLDANKATIVATITSTEITLLVSGIEGTGFANIIITLSTGLVLNERICFRNVVRYPFGVRSVVFETLVMPAQGDVLFTAHIPEVIADLVPFPAELQLTTYVPIDASDQVVFPDVHTKIFIGYMPLVSQDSLVFSENDEIDVLGQMPTLFITLVKTPESDILVVEGQPPILIVDQVPVPDNEVLAIASQPPITLIDAIVNPENDDLLATGQEPILLIDEVSNPDFGTLNITGQVSVLAIDHVSVPANEVLSITGLIPSMITIDKVLTPINEILNITAQVPTLTVDQFLAPANDGIDVTGQVPIATAALPAWLPTEDSAFAWWNTFDAGAISETGNLVTSLNDLSGNARHMPPVGGAIVTNATTLNGRNVIETNAGSYFTYSETGVAASHIAIICIQVDNADSFASRSLFSLDHMTLNNDYQVSNAGAPADYISRVQAGMGIGTISGTTSILGSLAIVAFVLDTANSSATGWVNGIQDFQSLTYDGTFTAEEICLLVNRGVNRIVEATWGEFILFSGTASDLIREKSEGYMAHGWGIEASLPALHPYKSAPPTI